MEYPVILNGAGSGRLTVTPKGLFTLFEAEAADTGDILRLSVYGGGKEGYLGVMQPADGRLYLSKRLSRSAMKDFPEEIEYAGPAGGASVPAPEPAAQPETESVPDGAQAEIPEDTDTLWFSAPDGTLSTFDGRRMLIALPAGDARVPRGAESTLRRINGRDYIVFPR